jgi:uncharacterized protein (UPF0335 family)
MQQWKTILWRDLEHWIMRIERAQKEKGELKPAPK